MEYPFDSKFKKIIDESEIGWDFLFSRPTQFLLEYMNLELLDNLEKNGYPGETVQKHFDELRTWPTDALFERAIADDDDSPALGLLQSSDSREIFEKASLSCRSTNPEERAVGVCVLMRTPGRTFHDEAVDVISAVSKCESESIVLEALCYAMTHLDIVDRLDVLRLSTQSPDAATCFSAAYSLGGLDEDLAIDQLIILSSDPDDDVRNWATFGLGDMTECDTPELREALVERLEDTHEECRHEAILGLAKRHDGRVKPALLKALQSKKVWRMAIDAAKELADPDFYERLIELRYGDTEDYLEEAIAACRPN
jgi:HEAT repeats